LPARTVYSVRASARSRDKSKGDAQEAQELRSKAALVLPRVSFFLVIVAAGGILYIDTTLLNAFLLALNFVAQLAFGILVMIVQFAAIFWFMSRSKVERIRPEDSEAITFDDYRGQPEETSATVARTSFGPRDIRSHGRPLMAYCFMANRAPARQCS
jgi:hypothetical protein